MCTVTTRFKKVRVGVLVVSVLDGKRLIKSLFNAHKWVLLLRTEESMKVLHMIWEESIYFQILTQSVQSYLDVHWFITGVNLTFDVLFTRLKVITVFFKQRNELCSDRLSVVNVKNKHHSSNIFYLNTSHSSKEKRFLQNTFEILSIQEHCAQASKWLPPLQIHLKGFQRRLWLYRLRVIDTIVMDFGPLHGFTLVHMDIFNSDSDKQARRSWSRIRSLKFISEIRD